MNNFLIWVKRGLWAVTVVWLLGASVFIYSLWGYMKASHDARELVIAGWSKEHKKESATVLPSYRQCEQGYKKKVKEGMRHGEFPTITIYHCAIEAGSSSLAEALMNIPEPHCARFGPFFKCEAL